MTYIDHIKNSVFATGCAPTLKVHLYAIRLIVKILLKFAFKDKKELILLAGDTVDALLQAIWKPIKIYKFWRNKYLNYLINKDWTKIDYYYFEDEDIWYDYLKKHPDRKEYFEKRKKIDIKMLEIYLDQERVDYSFIDKYTRKYM